jgi:hypothetical protein
MMLHRLLPLFLIVSIFAGHLTAQVTAPQPGPTSNARTIALRVDNGTPLQIALDKEVRVRKAGEPITGRVMQPVYVFDHLVIPVGTSAIGRIAAIARVPGRTRALHALPAYKLHSPV